MHEKGEDSHKERKHEMLTDTIPVILMRFLFNFQIFLLDLSFL